MSTPTKPTKHTVPVDEMQRILVEVGTGKKPAKPDTPEMARLRQIFAAEVDRARRTGMAIQVPSE